MSEAGKSMRTRAEKTAGAADGAQKRVTELRVSGHLMTLETGVFCIFQPPGSPVATDASGLPGIRLSLPPGPAGHPECGDASAPSAPDGWLAADDAAALVRVSQGPAQVLVTIYQSPEQPAETGPRLQVLRLSAEAAGRRLDAAAAPTRGERRRPRHAARDAAHAAHRRCRRRRSANGWASAAASCGSRGSRSIRPTVSPAEDIEYQAVLGRGWLSPWVDGGKFCGSRGMALPLLGVRVRLKGEAARDPYAELRGDVRRRHRDRAGRCRRSCEAESLAALEAFRVTSCRARRVRRQAATARVIAARAAAARPAAPVPAGAHATCARRSVRSGDRRLAGHVPADDGERTGSDVKCRWREISVRPSEFSRPVPAPRRATWSATGARDRLHHRAERQRHSPACAKVPYRAPGAAPRPRPISAARELDWRRAAGRSGGAHRRSILQALGFEPDIIIGHHGWGELLNLPDVWPRRAAAGLSASSTISTAGQRCRLRSGVSDRSVGLSAHPREERDQPAGAGAGRRTARRRPRWQLATYPDWARKRISLLPEGVDLELLQARSAKVRREPLAIGDAVIAPSDKLVTYVARDLEPYRGYHVMMRALPHLLRARKDVRVVMVGGDGVSYGAPPAERQLAGGYAERAERVDRSGTASSCPARCPTKPICACCSGRTRMSI